MKTSLRVLAAIAALAVPLNTHAQEVRCPQGYESLPTPPSGAERVLAACVRDPVQLVVTAASTSLAPASPEETDLVQQIAGRIGQQGGTLTPSPVRTETIGGIAARVADLAGSVTMPDGTTAQIEAMLTMLPAGTGTLVIMALSRDPAHAHVAPVVRALVPTIAGIGSSPPAWRASAPCPPGTNAAPAEPMSGNGMRRVARCIGEGGLQLEVLESRLPSRTADEARLPALNIQRSLNAQLQALAGQAQLDPTQPFEGQPGVRGFVTSLHGSATDPRAPAGSPGAMLRIEGAVAVLPTSIGHVEIVAISQSGDAATVARQMQSFARTQLRLDGTGVVAEQPAAPETDAGGAIATPATPPRRRHEIDPSIPLWDPGHEEAPHATTPTPARKSCGCTTPGHARHGEHAFARGTRAGAGRICATTSTPHALITRAPVENGSCGNGTRAAQSADRADCNARVFVAHHNRCDHTCERLRARP